MTKKRLDLSVVLFFLFIAVLISGCAAPATKKLDKFGGIQEKEAEGAESEFVIGVGDTINIEVYRKKTSEFIIGVGDSIAIKVSRKDRSEFILGVGDTISIEVYRKKTSEFIIGVGDSIAIKVSRKDRSEFILGVGDTIDIDVYRHDDLKRSVQLDTSGMIMLPLIGQVKAAGKTVTELRDEIEQRLSEYLVDPQVTIDVSSRQSLEIEELSKSFTISAQKAGKIIFPPIGELQADGKTVVELRDEIEQRLSKYFINPQVSIDVSSIENLKIDDLSLETEIDPTGQIVFPLIGEVPADGKTVVELREEIEQRLSEYMVNPQVTIDVSSRQSLEIEELSKSFTISAQKAGKIIFPPIGELQADGKTVVELRDEIEQRLSKYFINPQVDIDVSSIQSLKIDDLSLESKIDPTGQIMFPLIGEVPAAGKTIVELRDEIQQRLSEYFVNPQVTINVSSILSQKIHVLGEVTSPGSFTMEQKILIWEGILKAGGFTRDANEKKVLLVRSEKGIAKVNVINLDIKEMVKDGKLTQNAYLKNGDILYVPPKRIASVERFMTRFSNILEPFINLERGIILAPEAADVLRGKEAEREITISP
jgi:protein involved in polysaccharide export with SLBB domain